MNATGTWGRRAVWGTLAAVMALGCSPITMMSFLLHRDAKVPASFPLKAKEGSKKDEVTVAILCQTAGNVPPDFAGADRQLASLMAKRFPDFLKANGSKEKITIVPAAQVEKFKSGNPNWRAVNAKEIGKKLGADYVLDVFLSGMQVYQPGSVQMLYEGRAEVTVDVYDVAADDAEPNRYVHPFTYPRDSVRDATQMPVSRFKQQYMEHLALELIRYHVDHKPSDGIASGDAR